MTDIRKKEIIDRLRQIEGELSPENLCMDGEASPAYVRRRYQELMKEKGKLVAELGYEPDIYELYPKLRRPPTDA
jgi:hypothetical protein